MAKLTELNQYLIREKFLKIFGNKFHIMDENDQLYGFCEQKRFRIKEDIRLYDDESKNINTFISFFTASEKNYILLVMLDDPQIAKNLIYNYRGIKIKGTRNEAGWNAVYSSGKIIEKIGPILAINNKEILYHHVVKKTN